METTTQDYNCFEVIQTIGGMNFQGNIIPLTWFQHICMDNGKPDSIAIMLLSDILYWYRPVLHRDQESGQVTAMKKKFKSDILQKSYQEYADLFGFSKRQIIDAMARLESFGIIRRIFRTINSYTGKIPNVMYLQLYPKVLREITYSKGKGADQQQRSPDQTDPLPLSNEGDIPLNVDTNTETTTEITTHTSSGEDDLQKGEIKIYEKKQEEQIIEDMLNMWSQMVEPTCPVRRVTPTRQQRLSTLLREEFELTTSNWRKFCQLVADSDFLMGRSKSSWKVSLDWALNPNNFTKIVEGNYNNTKAKNKSGSGSDPDVVMRFANEVETAMDSPTMHQKWREVLHLMIEKYGMPKVRHWLINIEPICLTGPVVKLQCGSPFYRGVVDDNFKDDLFYAFRLSDPTVQKVEIVSKKQMAHDYDDSPVVV